MEKPTRQIALTIAGGCLTVILAFILNVAREDSKEAVRATRENTEALIALPLTIEAIVKELERGTKERDELKEGVQGNREDIIRIKTKQEKIISDINTLTNKSDLYE